MISKNFSIQEFVPKETYAKWGDKSIMFIDPRLVDVAQALRDKYGPLVINGGQYNYSGYRPPTCSVGAKESQHRFGRAIDCKFKQMTVQEVYKDILDNENYWIKKGISTLENILKTPSWLHVDIRWTGEDKIRIVNP